MLVPRFLGQAPPAATPVAMELTPDEVTEATRWGANEKVFFLNGYQWLSAMTAPKLKVAGTDLDYQGLVPISIKTVLDLLKAADLVITKLPPDVVGGVGELKAALEAVTQASGRVDEAIRRWRPLRDQVVQDLVAQGAGVEFEYFGDNPSQPNGLFKRVVDTGVEADVSALFSTKSPEELIEDGLSILGAYTETGVSYPILTSLRSLVGSMLSFFSIYRKVQEEKNFNAYVAEAIEADAVLTPAQKAEALSRVREANVLLGTIASSGVSLTTILLIGGVAAAALWLGPKLWK